MQYISVFLCIYISIASEILYHENRVYFHDYTDLKSWEEKLPMIQKKNSSQ